MTFPKGNKATPRLGSYAAIVGFVMYIATCMRPDLCSSASGLARLMVNPCDAHIEQAQPLLRVLSHKQAYRPRIGGSEAIYDSLAVCGDTGCANCPETRRSVPGQGVHFHGATVHRRLCKQSSIAKSAMIAEFYAASSAADECIYFANLLSEL
jgi:hypothetical protein